MNKSLTIAALLALGAAAMPLWAGAQATDQPMTAATASANPMEAASPSESSSPVESAAPMESASPFNPMATASPESGATLNQTIAPSGGGGGGWGLVGLLGLLGLVGLRSGGRRG